MTSPLKKSQINNPKLIKEQSKNYAFDTEMSQEPPAIQDREFSPWVRKKTNKINELQKTEKDKHSFLQKINISSKLKQRKILEGLEKEEADSQIQELRADLEKRIKEERIPRQDYIEIMKANRQTIDSRGFFQRRAGYSKQYRKPKSIDLSLNWDSKKVMKCAPYFSMSKPNAIDLNSQKNQNYKIKKVKRKKDLSKDGKRQFSETLNDFRRQNNDSVDINQVKKMFYKTLQLKISPIAPIQARGRSTPKQKQQKTIVSHPRIINLTARTKFPIKSQRISIEECEQSIISCEGKNMLSGPHRTRGEKIRHRNLQNKEVAQMIFFK